MEIEPLTSQDPTDQEMRERAEQAVEEFNTKMETHEAATTIMEHYGVEFLEDALELLGEDTRNGCLDTAIKDALLTLRVVEVELSEGEPLDAATKDALIQMAAEEIDDAERAKGVDDHVADR